MPAASAQYPGPRSVIQAKVRRQGHYSPATIALRGGRPWPALRFSIGTAYLLQERHGEGQP